MPPDTDRQPPDRKLSHDLDVLARFVRIFCDDKHAGEPRQVIAFKFGEATELLSRPPVLCGDCTKLLTHAVYKRLHCPMDPKPACKHCPDHCYHPNYRQRIREVMRYSGWRMIKSGRVDLLMHMLF